MWFSSLNTYSLGKGEKIESDWEKDWEKDWVGFQKDWVGYQKDSVSFGKIGSAFVNFRHFRNFESAWTGLQRIKEQSQRLWVKQHLRQLIGKDSTISIGYFG